MKLQGPGQDRLVEKRLKGALLLCLNMKISLPQREEHIQGTIHSLLHELPLQKITPMKKANVSNV